MLLRRDGEDNVKQPLGRSILSSDWILGVPWTVFYVTGISKWMSSAHGPCPLLMLHPCLSYRHQSIVLSVIGNLKSSSRNVCLWILTRIKAKSPIEWNLECDHHSKRPYLRLVYRCRRLLESPKWDGTQTVGDNTSMPSWKMYPFIRDPSF